MDFMLWYDSLIYPHDTFRAVRENASFSHTIRNIVVSGLIYGLIMGFIYEVFSSLDGGFVVNTARNISGNYFIFVSMIISPIIFLFVLFFSSFLIYLSARAFKGYGDFKTQTYHISLLLSFLILLSMLRVIPIIGVYMVMFLIFYSLRPLIVALKITHKYDSHQAVSTVISSLFMFLLIAGISLLLLNYSGIYVVFGRETTATGFSTFLVSREDVSYSGNSLYFSIKNTLTSGRIITAARAEGDCTKGIVDLDKKTKRIEAFITLDSGKTTEARIINCTRKVFSRGFFSVPLKFQYQNKKIGTGVTHLEAGVLEGLTG